MMRLVIVLALALHGLGHTVGFGVAGPLWFAAAWLVPGVGFVAGAWGFWKHLTWWQPLVVGSAILSLALEAAVGSVLQPGPYLSAALFNLVALLVLLVPRTRQLVADM